MEMKVATSPSDEQETLTVRRSESSDVQGIDSLVSPSTRTLFGRVDLINLLENANLAVTLTNESDGVLGHASFLDHPAADLVDQAEWEPFLQKHFTAKGCTPLNTLFLHFFVVQSDFIVENTSTILSAVFNAVTELDFICLLLPGAGALEPPLDELFEPLECLANPEPQSRAFICYRRDLCPTINVRQARVEDHDDIMQLFEEQTKLLESTDLLDQPSLLSEVIEAQNQEHQAAVLQVNGVTAGFISITTDAHFKQLRNYNLREFPGLCTPENEEQKEPTGEQAAGEEPTGKQAAQGEQAAGDEPTEERAARGEHPEREEMESTAGECPSNAFCIQLFVIDREHETRSVDFIPHVFRLFPDQNFCIIAVPTVSPEFPLLQTFYRVPPHITTSPPQPFDLYVCRRTSLSKTVKVRPAVTADQPAVSVLVGGLKMNQFLLQDLDHFLESRSDPSGVPLQVFVVQVQVQEETQTVGVVILRAERDLEFLRAHYNIENFIYFSYHSHEGHAVLRHFFLQTSFQHFSRHVFKEVLRLAHKSCLYHRLYNPHQENSCIHHLDFVLGSAVPIRPRHQIIYPLEELGGNAPSTQINNEQVPFALSLISRKLTLEPKVTISARLVVVGASDTGLSFLEELCFCPHLKFNNLTLISTHGLQGIGDHDDIGFLSTSHAYTSRDLAQVPLRSCVTVVTGKMVGINRKSKYVLVSSGEKVAYDHLILCMGLQYQVPNHMVSTNQLEAYHRHTSPVPPNFLTLNDLHDCRMARHWLKENFVELEENAIVYGNSIDVFIIVETLIRLGVRGPRIHLVLNSSDPVVSSFSDPVIQKAVVMALGKAEVQVHYNCLLDQLNHGFESSASLKTASFTIGTKLLQLDYGVFINLSNKGVDCDAFKSIIDSFLVFNSRLIINTTFQTSDDSIYGAGPLTGFSGFYHTDEWSHANFNSKEVGQALAAMLLPLFDPTQEPADEVSPGVDLLVPFYKQAKVQGGRLPGGLNYLNVTKPSETQLTGPRVPQGVRIVTGRVEMGNYFCLNLDRYERVETITCLSLEPIPFSNYLSLYGKHQQLLGQLLTRHRQGLIHDLYRFFRQSSFMAIYHDRFSDLEQELQQIHSTIVTKDADKPTLLQETRTALRNRAVRYLTFNQNLLPMFAKPGKL